MLLIYYFFFQAEDGIRDYKVTGVQTCALPIYGGDVRKAGVAVVPPADSCFGQLRETHQQVVVGLRVVVAPPGLSRPADVLVPQAAVGEAEELVGKSAVDRYLKVSSVGQDGGLR